MAKLMWGAEEKPADRGGSPPRPCFAVTPLDRALLALPGLQAFLGGRVYPSPFVPPGVRIQARIGWGTRWSGSGRRAAWLAALGGQSCWLLEDGFLRSVGLGNQDPPLSLVVDDQGIYYDAARMSRLESLIARPLLPGEAARAADLREAWRSARVSKYNHLREYAGTLPARYVLVVDQTWGDASIRLGLAGPESFRRMLDAALADYPEHTILVKTHPDVFAGRKRGHFDMAEIGRHSRVRVLSVDAHPVRLLERADAVYVVTSQMGFEGLLWGKPVRVFGMPFYAGWGLTQDELPPPQRRGRVGILQLVHAALVEYPRYVDPETGARCEVERVLEHLALQRRMRERFPPSVAALGISAWKRPILRDFFQGSVVSFPEPGETLPPDACPAVWGRGEATVPPGSRLLRVEDGFLRSVGLGGDKVRPISWVVDERGIYYDASCESGLEQILAGLEITEDLRRRARTLRERIVVAGLTKYNIGQPGWQRPRHSGRVILVPGQVENDASLLHGAPGIRDNLSLLRAVRTTNPDAYVVYKPHPDVLAGIRPGADGIAAGAGWCDEVVTDVAMGSLLDVVDEVHVMTSLAGFEALLRGKRVVCHGQPFYAGWGLTRDVLPVPRRLRRLDLDELVVGALIHYPTYVSRTTGHFTTPERALDELLVWRSRGRDRLPWWREKLRKALR